MRNPHFGRIVDFGYDGAKLKSWNFLHLQNTSLNMKYFDWGKTLKPCPSFILSI
jgi:hypothetical protein